MITIPTQLPALPALTANELSVILNISEATVNALAKTKQLPYFKKKNRIYFDFHEILAHFKLLERSAAA